MIYGTPLNLRTDTLGQAILPFVDLGQAIVPFEDLRFSIVGTL